MPQRVMALLRAAAAALLWDSLSSLRANDFRLLLETAVAALPIAMDEALWGAAEGTPLSFRLTRYCFSRAVAEQLVPSQSNAMGVLMEELVVDSWEKTV